HQRWHDTARRIVAGVLVRFVQARDVVIHGDGRIRGDLATANAAARNLGFERALGRLGADQGRPTRAVARVVLPAVGVYDLVCLFIGNYDVETQGLLQCDAGDSNHRFRGELNRVID